MITRKIEDRDLMWNTLSPFKEWFPLALLHSLYNGMANGEVEYISINENTSPTKMRWDGTLRIHLNHNISATNLVNKYISPSQADEISVEKDLTLRLWWD